MEKRNKNHLYVCERCLCGIECHEGKQAIIEHYLDFDDDEEDTKCDWCEEVGFNTLYELL